MARLPGSAWSQPSRYADTGVHHGYRRVELVSFGGYLEHAPAFSPILMVFAPVWAAWLSWIDPGGFILPHRDAGPWRERWQVPVSTAGSMLTDDGLREAEDGVPFRVEHWRTHAVVNDSDRPRIHLVIDRDVVVGSGRTGFVTMSVPDVMKPLVEKVL